MPDDHRRMIGNLIRYALTWAFAGAALAVLLVALLGGRSDEVSLPPVRETRLDEAAADAGCQLVLAGRGRRLNPPVDGAARERPAPPGVYEEAPGVEALIAALREGVIVVHFRRGVSQALVDELGELQGAVPEGTIVTPNATGMPFELAVAAHRRLLGCPRFSPATLDAVRLFVGRYLGGPAGWIGWRPPVRADAHGARPTAG